MDIKVVENSFSYFTLYFLSYVVLLYPESKVVLKIEIEILVVIFVLEFPEHKSFLFMPSPYLCSAKEITTY